MILFLGFPIQKGESYTNNKDENKTYGGTKKQNSNYDKKDDDQDGRTSVSMLIQKYDGKKNDISKTNKDDKKYDGQTRSVPVPKLKLNNKRMLLKGGRLIWQVITNFLNQ